MNQVRFGLCLLVMTVLAGCETTGGAIGNLIPAPKFLKGEIQNNIYMAQDKFFSVSVPHQKGSYEYSYMQVKEQYAPDGTYVSFGPAALDQSIYRIQVVKQLMPFTPDVTFNNAAKKVIESYKNQLEQGYETTPKEVKLSQEKINGWDTYHWQLVQTVPAGKYYDNKEATFAHDVYVIDFDNAIVMLGAQIPETTTKAALSPQAFAESFAIHCCTELTKSKIGNDGTYRFKQEPIVVSAPNECLVNMLLYDTDRSVDFRSEHGYWTSDGLYAMQVYPIPENIKDTNNFLAETEKYAPGYMVKDRASLGLKLKMKEAKPVEVSGKPGYQAISVDEGKAVFIATYVLHARRITVASLVYPLKGSASATEQIPWKCYDKFVNSVHETE